ncbi:MAG: phosphoribosylglycinamide formyltransferase [Pseudonocardiales bacterium]|nr:MAG: phosphoribosylglycinamide formyltransferase [Pseudonocardiales bacterium]
MSIDGVPGTPAARLVVLASGTGTLLQALLDACQRPEYPARVVAVGSDRVDAEALVRAQHAGVAAFALPVRAYPNRDEWDRALGEEVAGHRPDVVVLAGFMKLLSSEFLNRFPSRVINTHPALLPAFPGMHGVRDALAYGVKVTGCTLFVVDDGVDGGPVVAQAAVPVADIDDERSLHERIKVAERAMLVDTLDRMCRLGWTVTGRRVSIP